MTASWSPIPTASPIWTCSAVSRSTCSATVTPPSSRPSPPSSTRLGHTSNLYATEPGIALAEALVGHLGTQARVFFCNSGTEANEVAFKITRLTGKTNIVAAQGAFHGRTMGSLALTGQPTKQAPFEPLPGNVTHVPYGDVEALAAAVDSDTAAVFLRTDHGGGRCRRPARRIPGCRPGHHHQERRATGSRRGADRSGAYRCVLRPSARRHHPDVVTLAKGLGGGLPIGACLAIGRGR